MDIYKETQKLYDIIPDCVKAIAKEYDLNEQEIMLTRKKVGYKNLKIEKDERAAIRYINTADLDRDGEIVIPCGAVVKDFLKNPVVLFCHDNHALPIGKDVSLELIEGKGWLAKTVYADHQVAWDAYNCVKGGFLNTSSIGFVTLAYVLPDGNGWKAAKNLLMTKYGIKEKEIDKARCIITKWLLLEHSDVPIAANANALNLAVGKSLDFELKSDTFKTEYTVEKEKGSNTIKDESTPEITPTEDVKEKESAHTDPKIEDVKETKEHVDDTCVEHGDNVEDVKVIKEEVVPEIKNEKINKEGDKAENEETVEIEVEFLTKEAYEKNIKEIVDTITTNFKTEIESLRKKLETFESKETMIQITPNEPIETDEVEITKESNEVNEKINVGKDEVKEELIDVDFKAISDLIGKKIDIITGKQI